MAGDRARRAIATALAVLGCAGAIGACGGGDGSGGDGNGGGGSRPAAAAGDAPGLEQAFVQAVKTVGPRVVQISTQKGLGSGVVFDGDGHIVTNAHVVEGAQRVQVTAADGHRYPGRVLGSFPPDDLAVVEAQGRSSSPRRSPTRPSSGSATSCSPSATRSGCGRR